MGEPAPKEELYRLVDQLPESEVLPAQRYLEYLRDRQDRHPLLVALDNLPEEDEPISEEEEAMVEEALEAVERGEVVSLEDARRELGL